MKILVDENIPRITVDRLVLLGHDVKDIRGGADQGLPDPELWRVAITESRLLVTTDKGFTSYRTSPHYGILVVRLRQPNRHKIHSAAMVAMQRFKNADWPNRLVIVRDTTLSTSVFSGA